MEIQLEAIEQKIVGKQFEIHWKTTENTRKSIEYHRQTCGMDFGPIFARDRGVMGLFPALIQMHTNRLWES